MSSPVRASTGPAPAFVKALRERRVHLGITQQELASRLGWQRNRLHEYEAGIRPILPRLLVLWAGALGMRIVAVPIGESEDPAPDPARGTENTDT